MDKELGARIDTLRKAAKGGDVKAQVDLAVMYSHGEEVPVDNKEALRWYDAAARGGDQFAQFMLGLWYFLEDPSDSAPRHAAHWLRKAAQQGFPDAALPLGEVFFHHPEVARNSEGDAPLVARRRRSWGGRGPVPPRASLQRRYSCLPG